MGGKRFALPWDLLEYDTGRNAYLVDVPEDRLKGAPNYGDGSEPAWGDPDYNLQLHDYYGSKADWYL
jgi:hypothetical protein